MSQIRPIHHSIFLHRKRLQFARISGMDSTRIDHETREGLERIAIGIFTDMVNSGASFQEALSAIYVSGLQHAIEARHEH